MKLSKENREVFTALFVLLLSAILCIASASIPIKNEAYTQSARIFPQIVSGILLLLSALYLFSACKKSVDLSWARLRRSAAAFFKSHEVRRVALAILFVAAYLFIGVQKGRFYLCSLGFMLFVLLVYVRRIKPWLSIIAACGFICICWLLFFKLFMVQLY